MDIQCLPNGPGLGKDVGLEKCGRRRGVTGAASKVGQGLGGGIAYVRRDVLSGSQGDGIQGGRRAVNKGRGLDEG